jgi:hypothetical protein
MMSSEPSRTKIANGVPGLGFRGVQVQTLYGEQVVKRIEERGVRRQRNGGHPLVNTSRMFCELLGWWSKVVVCNQCDAGDLPASSGHNCRIAESISSGRGRQKGPSA